MLGNSNIQVSVATSIAAIVIGLGLLGFFIYWYFFKKPKVEVDSVINEDSEIDIAVEIKDNTELNNENSNEQK
jgi:plastocyanin domain-containing protein